jgi:glycine cleavage system regulatory protein
MRTSIALTIIAEDQPGIINTVSEVLYKYGGAWTESSMATLAGQFAGILLASVATDKADACVEELKSLDEQGIRVVARLSRTSPTHEIETRGYVLDLVGNDRRGIVHDITTILARHDINVQNLETVVESVAMGGGEVFKAKALLIVPVSTDINVLETELEDLANELMVDIHLES